MNITVSTDKVPTPCICHYSRIPFLHLCQRGRTDVLHYSTIVYSTQERSTFVDLFGSGSCFTPFHPVTWSQPALIIFSTNSAWLRLYGDASSVQPRNGLHKCIRFIHCAHLHPITVSVGIHPHPTKYIASRVLPILFDATGCTHSLPLCTSAVSALSVLLLSLACAPSLHGDTYFNFERGLSCIIVPLSAT